MAALLVSAAKVNADLAGAFIILPSREPEREERRRTPSDGVRSSSSSEPPHAQRWRPIKLKQRAAERRAIAP
jgi:hypothetical protein